MARLIIGHTTDESVRIWVRGDKRNPVAFLNVSGPQGMSRNIKQSLEERFGYTGIFDVGTLLPSTNYQCSVTYGESIDEPASRRIEFGETRGQFKTFPEDSDNQLKFLLGSCNLHSLGIWQNPDPSFRTLLQIAESESVDLMVHCGDQIYYDIPNFKKWPHFEEYRLKYLDAWGDSRPTRKFLTRLPHYMMLDDHELANNFANDMTTRSGAPAGDVKKHGIRVYREFQHIHNPDCYDNQALYFYFQHGGIEFFCLDTRSERIEDTETADHTQMIDHVQMGRFKSWLTRNKNSVKFVISSVPFVGHVINNKDKWCSPAFRAQREEIITHILDKEITGVIFLTGDMHNSYHATMDVVSENKQAIIHELMSSPINQTSKSSFGKYLTPKVRSAAKFTYTSKINKGEFFNDHSNAMLLKVKGRSVSWEVFRARNGDRKEIVGTFTV